MLGVKKIRIPDTVEELCESCIGECYFLRRVTFGRSSSLKLVDKDAFLHSALGEISIPCGVEGVVRDAIEVYVRVIKLA